MHIRAIGNVVNNDFHAVCQSFCYLIHNQKIRNRNTFNHVSTQQSYVSDVEQDQKIN